MSSLSTVCSEISTVLPSIAMEHVAQSLWFDLAFALRNDPGRLLDLIERLDGTRYRIAPKIARASEAQLTHQPDGKWSVKEQIGHLYQIEALWLGRIDDILDPNITHLRSWDLENRSVRSSQFQIADTDDLIRQFNQERSKLVARVRQLPSHYSSASALHPRLQQPFYLLELFQFVAEHDDYHLAQIEQLIRTPH